MLTAPFQLSAGLLPAQLMLRGIAMSATHFSEGIRQLETVWGTCILIRVYRSDLLGVLQNTLRSLGSLTFKHMAGKPVSLLDNLPLKRLLGCRLPFRGIRRSIHAGALHALGITAWGYASGQSVTFYQGCPEVTPWKRAQRVGVPVRIGLQHLVASASIPFVFPAIRVQS
jgi:NTE family protein